MTFEKLSFTDSKDVTGARFNTMGHVTMTTPIRGQFIIPRLAFNIFYLHTKFCDSRFSRSGDIIAVENGSCHPGHAPFRGGLSSVSWDLTQSTCEQNLTILASAVP